MTEFALDRYLDWSAGEQKRRFLAEQRLAFTMFSPRAFMSITGLADGYERPLNLERLYTRHSAGIIEMERARRRAQR